MKREVIEFKVPKQRQRHSHLFTDAEFRPRKEALANQYRRQDKHRKNFHDYTEKFYL